MPGIILSGIPEPLTIEGKALVLVLMLALAAEAGAAAAAAKAAGVPGKGLPHWAWTRPVEVESVTAQSAQRAG
jgi:hypothetical protein